MATWRCGAARDLPLNLTTSWNGAAARASIFDWAGFGSDNPDPAKARRGFLAYDADAPTLRRSYKLPFARVESGKLTALASGVRAAASRLPQTNGISDAVKSSARGVLDAYESRIHEGQNAMAEDTDLMWPAFRAGMEGIRTVTDELATMARSQAPDPSVFDEHPPFFFRSVISNSHVDSYFTRMMPSTLRNYAAEAEAGVALVNSHMSRELPLGRSISGHFTAGANARVVSDAYMIPGISNGAIRTDDVIAGIRAGIYRDISVGWTGGEMMCSICNSPMFGRRALTCPHFPGVTYTNDAGVDELAVGQIEGAHLSEYSIVFDGATPGAMIEKAFRMVEMGLLTVPVANFLERQYRITPRAVRGWSGWSDLAKPVVLAPSTRSAGDSDSNDDGADSDSGDEEHLEMLVTNNDTDSGERSESDADVDAESDDGASGDVDSGGQNSDGDAVETSTNDGGESGANATPAGTLGAVSPVDLQSMLRRAGAPPNSAASWFSDELIRQRAEVVRLQPLAEIGQVYQDEMVEQAVHEGIRAFGNRFSEVEERVKLRKLSMPEIKRERERYAEIASERLATGRLTTDGDPASNVEKPTVQAINGRRHIPDSAYAQ